MMRNTFISWQDEDAAMSDSKDGGNKMSRYFAVSLFLRKLVILG